MDAERGPRGRSKPEKSKDAWKLLPDVWELIEPRKAVLGLGFGLMLINRVAGLVLPGSTKFLIDNVIGKHQRQLLLPIILAVVCATLVQGITSFSLTQLLSKSSQRMITDLASRCRPTSAVCRWRFTTRTKRACWSRAS